MNLLRYEADRFIAADVNLVSEMVRFSAIVAASREAHKSSGSEA